MFFLTFLQLGVAWPFLTNEKIAEALLLGNKKATPQERKTLLFPCPLLLPTGMWRGDSEERLLSCDLDKPGMGLTA